MADWIWLNEETYPAYQAEILNCDQISELAPDVRSRYKYCVADFQKEYRLRAVPEKVEVRVSGDAHFRLWINNEWTGEGPAAAGGDFLQPEKTLNWYYYNPYTIHPDTDHLQIYAEVQLSPQVLTEFTYLHGGFWFECVVTYADGTRDTLTSGPDWLARLDGRYPAPCTYDDTISPDTWGKPSVLADRPQPECAPVRMLVFEDIFPSDPSQRSFSVHTGDRILLDFDRIYGASLFVRVSGACELEFLLRESEGVGQTVERVKFAQAGTYRSFRMHSVGECVLRVLNAAEGVTVTPQLIFIHYPVDECGTLKTSDDRLNRIFDLCRRTLEICRQTIHLDSTTHQELLACTGDYYIESLMTLFTFGDQSLSAADVLRTAKWLTQNDGRMFHTNYSLIWVQMLRFVYMATGDRELVTKCRAALNKLLDRFAGYLGANGVIDNPPDYMFLDWMEVDGYTLHHPPKYLGQTVMNAFYYKALTDACFLAKAFGWQEEAQWQASAASLKAHFDAVFYDSEKEMYFDGLPDPTGESKWLPANKPRKHFSRYPNILAPLYGLCDRERAERLIRMVSDDSADFAPIQPYFMTFLLQAQESFGLLRELGQKQLLKWMTSVNACEKGLQEGWYKPDDNYKFDHSHAWGGCPAYFIPQMLLNLRLVQPGFREITLSPDLCGLDSAEITFPTPLGQITCRMKAGQSPEITVPNGIHWHLDS